MFYYILRIAQYIYRYIERLIDSHIRKVKRDRNKKKRETMYTPLLAQTGGSSKPLMDGTIVYFVLTLLGIVIVFGLTGSGKIPKNDMG